MSSVVIVSCMSVGGVMLLSRSWVRVFLPFVKDVGRGNVVMHEMQQCFADHTNAQIVDEGVKLVEGKVAVIVGQTMEMRISVKVELPYMSHGDNLATVRSD